MRLSAWVSLQFCLYCLGRSSITHGLIICVQFTQARRWVSCLSRLLRFLLSSLFSSLVPCQPPSVYLWVRLARREMFRFCFLFSLLSSLCLLPAVDLGGRLGSCLLSLLSAVKPIGSAARLFLAFCVCGVSGVCVCVCVCVFGAPCKSPNCDSNLF